MTQKEALEIITEALAPESLNTLQVDVFVGAWNKQSYHTMARDLNHEYSYIKDVGAELWKMLSQALGIQVTKLNLQNTLARYAHQEQGASHTLTQNSSVDWGEAIDVSQFYGRQTELGTLEKWVIQERCRFVAIVGMGGIGKTMLVTKLAHQLMEAEPFEIVVWRSLRQAPPLIDFLTDLMQAIAPDRSCPAQFDALLRQLLEQLRQHRCLLIFDNVEAVLSSGELVGTYRTGYEAYGALFQQLAEGQHQSSVLLTSREVPSEVATQASPLLPVRLLRLGQLSIEEGELILAAKGVSIQTNRSQVRELIDRYQGNPLALKIVATQIQDLYDNNIAAFLEQETQLFKNIRDLLTSQFDRLSVIERQVMYWLAIDREAVSAEQLQADLLPSITHGKLQNALVSLDQRSLIEKTKPTIVSKGFSYTQQPVVMEYVTERLIEQVCEEVEQAQIDCLKSHALTKAQAKEYVRDIQTRLIVQPILVQLIESQGGRENLKALLLQLLRTQQDQAPLQPGYFAGNAINLLCQIGADLSHLDFSNLAIWQADLRMTQLHGANFSQADLSHSIFTQAIDEILCVAFSPDAKQIATSHSSGEVCIWRVEDGQQIATFRGIASGVNSIVFSLDGESLIISDVDRVVKRLHIGSGTVQGRFYGHTGSIWKVALSAEGRLLASGGEDLTIRIWDMQTQECLHILEGYQGWVAALAFAPLGQTLTEGYLLASNAADGTIRLWNVETGQTLHVLEGHTSGVLSVAFSPDGQTIASSSQDQTIRLWDVRTGQAIAVWQAHEGAIWTLAFSPDGRILASGSEDQTIKLWNVETQHCYRTLLGHTGVVQSISYSPDGLALVSAALNQCIRLWETRTGQCLKIWQGYSKGVFCVVFHPNGQKLASAHGDKGLRLWDTQTGECLKWLQGHSDRITSVAFSPDGRLLASGSYDRTIRLWDVESGNFLRAFRMSSWVKSVDFNRDGSMLASSGIDRTVRLWEVETGRCLRVIEPAFTWVPAVAFSPTENCLAIGGETGSVELWDATHTQCLLTLEGHTRQTHTIAFAPIADRLASGSYDHSVRVWNLQTGQCLQTLEGHRREVLSINFHPQENLLVSGSYDQTLKLWDVEQETNIMTLQGHTSPIWSVMFDPSGRRIASGSEDGSIRLWDSHTGECLRVLTVDRPYEDMNISGTTGLTDAQKESLRVLGAIER
ncbi:WD40 domain-containing protein [Leptolyngbya sp. NIES-2104]|uniref:WD40 domain-containing protein n=1 Tax=Leptolyngbya sp. NIES-2104 TaxID=1552121 RepID=UPI0006EC7C84|nr:NB-ARC domain-containing protein [Leptolyngbya sp. NIES-2104]GAP94297.1 high-affnity carbon uptake protein Hat/HatR [Leptolyngbya sp. NIES-2104]